MDSLTYSNVVCQLKSDVPELWRTGESFSEDLPHDVFGTLSQVLCGWLRAKAVDEDVIDRVVDFLNAMAVSNDSEVINLLEVSVFEVLCDEEDCVRAIEPKLGERAHAHLIRVRQGGLPM